MLGWTIFRHYSYFFHKKIHFVCVWKKYKGHECKSHSSWFPGSPPALVRVYHCTSLLCLWRDLQFSSVTQPFPTLRPRGLQHARPLCPSPTPRVCSNSCPLSRWCHPTISSSVIPFFSCLQSFPASGSLERYSIPKMNVCFSLLYGQNICSFFCCLWW